LILFHPIAKGFANGFELAFVKMYKFLKKNRGGTIRLAPYLERMGEYAYQIANIVRAG